MSFNLQFPGSNPSIQQFKIEPGEMLYILGANGSGKSSLMYLFSQQNMGRVRKISAHRQTWMNSDALDMTPKGKAQTEQEIIHQDKQFQSRYRDTYAAQRASMTIYELIDSENIRARAITKAVDAKDINTAEELAEKPAPTKIINELLRQSNIPITISIEANERIMASKNNGAPYSAAELSDGERNALLIAGNVLTAPPDSLLLIDEPERHLHRSIISPLLNQLFEQRSDCAFVISTHDYDLPMEVPEARTLLLRTCNYNGQNVQNWEADEIPANAPIDDMLKRDLLGSRRKILFVEGTESSLDKPLYSLIFPMVSVIPKGSCRDVEHAVEASRDCENLHWLQSFGIVDGDGYTASHIDKKRENGIYALPYYSVESIYFHPQIIHRIAERQAAVSGEDACKMAQDAIAKGLGCISKHTERLSRKVAKKTIRDSIMKQIPNDDKLLRGEKVVIENDAKTISESKKAELDKAIINSDWEVILTKCSVRETDALEMISVALNFRKIKDYEKAVRNLLMTDHDTVAIVRDLFGDLLDKLDC